jgi:hypothetical protein
VDGVRDEHDDKFVRDDVTSIGGMEQGNGCIGLGWWGGDKATVNAKTLKRIFGQNDKDGKGGDGGFDAHHLSNSPFGLRDGSIWNNSSLPTMHSLLMLFLHPHSINLLSTPSSPSLVAMMSNPLS